MFMESFAQLSVPFQGFEFAVDAVQGIDQQGSAEKMDAANVQPVWVTADADPMFIRQVDPKAIPGFFSNVRSWHPDRLHRLPMYRDAITSMNDIVNQYPFENN